MDYKLALTLLGLILAIGNYFFYFKATLSGHFRPHLFSWMIWSLLCAIACAAQISENAGYAIIQTGFMTIGTAAIAVAAIFKGDKNYTPSDWIALAFSLAAIPLWIVTSNPVWSVILITIIDVVATWPTLRKSWADPDYESPRVFIIAAVICLLNIAALSVFNVTTMLYTGAITLINFTLAGIILYRRKCRTKLA